MLAAVACSSGCLASMRGTGLRRLPHEKGPFEHLAISIAHNTDHTFCLFVCLFAGSDLCVCVCSYTYPQCECGSVRVWVSKIKSRTPGQWRYRFKANVGGGGRGFTHQLGGKKCTRVHGGHSMLSGNASSFDRAISLTSSVPKVHPTGMR